MIKINLLGDDTAVDNSGTFIVGGYIASLVLVIVVFLIAYRSAASTAADLTEESEMLTVKLAQLKELTKEVRELEAKRKSLEDKLVVIASLQKNKLGPVRVMDDLNMSMPEKSWILDIKEASGTLRIGGMALDNQTIASFMRDLEASDYFEKVDLVEARQAVRDGVKIKAFTIQSRVLYTGAILPKKSQEQDAVPATSKESKSS